MVNVAHTYDEQMKKYEIGKIRAKPKWLCVKKKPNTVSKWRRESKKKVLWEFTFGV